MKIEEKVICSAIWCKELPLKNEEITKNKNMIPNNVDRGIVISGWRHQNCIVQIVAITGLRMAEIGEYESGFLTNHNRYVGREEGAEIALRTKQIEKLNFHSKRLFSEDLY
ncbi:hypothetical protein BPT24_256 [Tenacibaculum phage pT24]|uniref:Uncharacterized protein n=1 Tax=Tenacibaculum phage pT24 TaxID=1880590 RepID=A0A1B4XX42_9CAUD|nr:hypothetical protein HYP10_gp272 [Tenacibaculum phage pT24]BAV39375.1 hypothetical protein BPT24_256 [Tenacibaculum phage pT24]